MNKFSLTLILLFSFSLLNAQIFNSDFENYENPPLTNSYNASGSIAGVTFYICAPTFSYQELEQWSSTNQLTNTPNLGDVELVTQSTMAQSGASSIRIESADIDITGYLGPGCTAFPQSVTNVAPGLIVNGKFKLDVSRLINDLAGGQGVSALNPFNTPGVGNAIDFKPRSLSGYYQYNGAVDPATNLKDSCFIISGLTKNGELIGYISQRLPDAGTWTPFSIDYTHLNCETPDSILTVISSSNLSLRIVDNEFEIIDDYTGVSGSVLFMDNLSVDTVDLAELPPLLFPDVDTIFSSEVSNLDVVANDEFCDMGTYAPIIETTAINGTLVVTAQNEIEYTPNLNFEGTENYSYYICNAVGICDTTTVRIEVIPVPMCIAIDDIKNVVVGNTSQFDPRENDLDCGTAINIARQPNNGTVSIASNGFTITYSPNNDFTGQDDFDYYICSPIQTLQCDTATVRFSVVSAINEIDANLLSLSPNPAQNFIYLQVDVQEEVSFKLINILGEILSAGTFDKRKMISLDHVDTGFYFIEIKTGNQRSVRKIQVVK